MVLPQEKQAIRTISSLPNEAVIISTQRNNNLVKIYGKKDFVQIKRTGFDLDSFNDEVKKGIDDYAEWFQAGIFSNLYIGRQINAALVYNGKPLYKSDKYEPVYDREERMNYLKAFDIPAYKEVYREVSRVNTLSEKEKYFLYSFAKLDHGILKTRGWWLESSDVKDYEFFKNYQGDTVYKDENFILIRLK
jgi:hypothetical protein